MTRWFAHSLSVGSTSVSTEHRGVLRRFVTPLLVAWASLLAGCDACPYGTERADGFCTTVVAPDDAGEEPVDEANFQQKFNIRRCQAAESCLAEEGYDTDFWDVECDEPWSWDDGCPFDQLAAERCLDADWACSSAPGLIYVSPSDICDEVYRCDG